MWERLQRLIGRERSESRFRHSLGKRLEKSPRTRTFARRFLRVLIALGAVAMLTWLFPQERTTEFSSWREGMVAPREVIAPFSFNVRKNDVELDQERARARSSVAPVVRLSAVGSEEEARLMRFLKTVDESGGVAEDSAFHARGRLYGQTLHWLNSDGRNNIAIARQIAPDVLRTIYGEGVLSVDDAAQLEDLFKRRSDKLGGVSPLPEQVTVVRDDTTEYSALFNTLRSIEQVRDELSQMIARKAMAIGVQLSSEGLRSLHNLLDTAIGPNLEYDRQETITRQTKAAANVALYKRTIFNDERFIESHAGLTSEDINELLSLMEAQRQRQRETYRWQPIIQWVGRVALVAAVVLMIGVYLREFHPAVWSQPGWFLLCMLLVWLPLTVASFAAVNPSVPTAIVPLALTAMLGTILFNAEVGLALSGGAILLAGAILGFDYRVVLVNAVAAVIAAFSVRNVRNRNQFLRSMFFLPVGIVGTIVAIDTTQGTSVAAMWEHGWPGAVNGVAVPILAMGLLIVCEKFFTITTSMTLLELSDLNSPLLRELSLRAPGTYTHSIIIANLTEKAAEAIGANPLLVRVGSYYHDIGKMQRPDHFVENQLYVRNPHDKLSPQMSALVVAAHVKDGIELAERVGLPKQIVDFIPQHHGTLLMTYFYRKAQSMYGAENVREEAFRYPGPKPQSKEAAILMMADAVEAAVRSLHDRTPSRVQGLVHQLIKERLDDGQFDECNLTLRDLDLIEKSFLPVLVGALHRRIEYPKAPAPHPDEAGEGPAPTGRKGEAEQVMPESESLPPASEPSEEAVRSKNSP